MQWLSEPFTDSCAHSSGENENYGSYVYRLLSDGQIELMPRKLFCEIEQ